MKTEKASVLHRELWTWLSDNPTLSKIDWPRWGFGGGDGNIPRHAYDCFACGPSRNCGMCALQWRGGQECYVRAGEFSIWCRARNNKHFTLAANIARIIANKEFSYDYEIELIEQTKGN